MLIISSVLRYIAVSEDDGGGASIHTTQQKRSEGLDILRMIDKDNIGNNHGMKSSQSMGSLDQSVKAPNEVCAHHINPFL